MDKNAYNSHPHSSVWKDYGVRVRHIPTRRLSLYSSFTAGFREGIASLFGLGRDLSWYFLTESSKKADYKAIQSDWEFVGRDIWDGIYKFAEAHSLEAPDVRR